MRDHSVMATHLPGLELSRLFYEEAVSPILLAQTPGLVYSAALIGRGSEVLGLDTTRSVDHDWGPRVHVFMSEDADQSAREEVTAILEDKLPATFPWIQHSLRVSRRASRAWRGRGHCRPLPHGAPGVRPAGWVVGV